MWATVEYQYSILWSEYSRRAVGNFHALLMFRSQEELPAIRDAVHRMVHRAISLDGTCELQRTLFYAHLTRSVQARGNTE